MSAKIHIILDDINYFPEKTGLQYYTKLNFIIIIIIFLAEFTYSIPVCFVAPSGYCATAGLLELHRGLILECDSANCNW